MARKYWWPNTLPAQRAMMANCGPKIATHQIALGLTNLQVTTIQNICTTFLAVYDWIESTRETMKSASEWRDDYFYDKAGAPPSEPVFQPYTPPGTPADQGLVNLFKATRDLIVNLPGFTEAIGEDLGFLGEEINPISPPTVQPTIQVFAAANGHHFSIVVANRAEATQWDVYITRKGGTPQKHSSYTGKSADVYVDLQVPGDAEQIQVYVQLRKNNADYGQPSQTANVTLNP